jgi:hypothetical protein
MGLLAGGAAERRYVCVTHVGVFTRPPSHLFQSQPRELKESRKKYKVAQVSKGPPSSRGVKLTSSLELRDVCLISTRKDALVLNIAQASGVVSNCAM